MHRIKPNLYRGVTLGIAAALIATTMPTGIAAASPSRNGCESRNNNTAAKLLECVTPGGVQRHLARFAAIAKANEDPEFPGSRATGTQGYQDSVEYVAGQLRRAGYDVTLSPFLIVDQPAQLRQLEPTQADYPTGAFLGSGEGEVTGRVLPVGLSLDVPEDSTSACTAADFDGLDFSGTTDIALIQRGGCGYGRKVENAQRAGAEAVVIFNQGTPDELGLAPGGLLTDEGEFFFPDVPVVAATYANGVALSQGATAYVNVMPYRFRSDVNVIADLPGQNRENVVMAGAHLDSVGTSPGINDNGSGAAALLETALLMANHEPQNSLRFAWWGAEEEGLAGSSAYVAELSPSELDRIALYLNYDMIASPNYVFGILEGDPASPPAGLPIPPGSAAIENVYQDYFTQVGVPFTAAALDGRSDYAAFFAYGVPSGGLFTGAEGKKTSDEAAVFGGTAGQPYDPCYHTACDDLGNVDRHALAVNSDAMAYAQLTFAYSTEAVNGVPGARMPGGGKLPKPDAREWPKLPGPVKQKWHDKWHGEKLDKARDKMRKHHEKARKKVEASYGRLRIPGKVSDNRPGYHRAPRDIA